MAHESKKSWPGALFRIIFVVSGLAAAYRSAGKMIFGYIASSNRVESQATIHDVNLVRNHGDTTTYLVKSNTHNEVTEYYAIVFKFNGNKKKIVDGIEDKKEAQPLKDEIIQGCFNDRQQAMAA